MTSESQRKLRVKGLLFALITFSTGVHAQLSPPLSSSRQIIASGEMIQDFGRIGYGSIRLKGIDGEGRVLLGAGLSDGRIALFVGDARGVREIWRSTLNGPLMQIEAAQISDNGRIVAPTFAYDAFSFGYGGLFEVRDDELHRLLGLGDVTEAGDVVCEIADFAMDRLGNLAVLLSTAASVARCEDYDYYDYSFGVYSLENSSLRRILEVDDDLIQLIGITDERLTVVSLTSGRIVATDGIRSETLLEVGPPGSFFPSTAAVNANGSLVLLGYDGLDNALYAATDGKLHEIVRIGDTTPEGDVISFLQDASIDGDGSIFVGAYWPTTGEADGYGHGILRYSANGAGVLLGRGLSSPRVNHAGQLAAVRRHDSRPSEVVQLSGDRFSRIVDGAAEAPGGGWFATGGVGPACISDDGRVGFTASTTGSLTGLLCADRSGIHRVVPASDDGEHDVHMILECAFSDQALFFMVSEGEYRDHFESTFRIYRADSNGVTRLIAPGDALEGGGTVRRLRFIHGRKYFGVNRGGSIVVPALTDEGEGVVVRRQDGTLEAVYFKDDDAVAGFVLDVGITSEEAIVAVVELPVDEPPPVGEEEEYSEPVFSTAVVVSDGKGFRTLARTGDATIPGGPYRYFYDLRVSGELAWFIAVDSQSVGHLLQYDFARSTLRAIQTYAREGDFGANILAVSSEGRLLYELRNSDRDLPLLRYVVDANGVGDLLSSGNDSADLWPIAINDGSHVLLRSYASPLGASIDTLRLAGPEVSESCAEFGAQPSQSNSNGCHISGPENRVAWELALLLPFLLRRRAKQRIPFA